MRRLILFDVDGTLLSTNGEAGRALGAALRETFGTAGPIEGYAFAGKTDPQIVFELTGDAGIPRHVVEPRLGELFERYCGHLEAALSPANTRALPGVDALLAGLAARDDVAVGLLTGNIAAGARIKLRAAGLEGWFDLGAYGSDHEDRDRLVPIARARARDRWGSEFAGRATVVIGDAEADVRCARAGGAWSVAVASGKTARARLEALAPDALLESLASPEAMAAVLGPGG